MQSLPQNRRYKQLPLNQEIPALVPKALEPRPETRKRERIDIWVDTSKPKEYWIAGWADELKQSKSFKQTLLDAMTMAWEFANGVCDSFRAKFPEVYDSIWLGGYNAGLAAARAEQEAQQAQEIRQLRQMIETMMANATIQQTERVTIERTTTVTPRRVEIEEATQPVVVVGTAKKASAREVANNFLSSMTSFFD